MYSGSRWPDRTTHELEDPNVGQLSLGASPIPKPDVPTTSSTA